MCIYVCISIHMYPYTQAMRLRRQYNMSHFVLRRDL